MKVITYVTAGLWKNTGGPAESVPKMIKEISRSNNFKINLITLEGDLSENVTELYDYNISIYVVKKLSSSNLYFNPSYNKVFKKLIPESDIIHIQGIWLFPFWLASFYALIFKKKVIISPRGSLNPNRLKKSRLKKLISKFLFDKSMLNRASLIHATSKIEKDNVSLFGVTTDSFIVPNGVDILNRNEFTTNLIKTEKRICLFFGRLDPIKGLDILIESWRRINNDSWLLVICGPDEKNYKKTLENKINKYSLSESVSIIEPIYGSKKYNLFTQAEIFVLPSHGENFGISIAEALVCGLPVITTNLTPWSEIIKYKCGWYISLDQDSLVEALKNSFSLSSEELSNMGIKGINLIKNNYSWKELSKRMINVYKDFLYEK